MTDTPFNARRRTISAGLGGLIAAPGLVLAQTAAPAPAARWKPERPITIFNPFSAGGVTDLHLRFLAERVGRILGQQVLVEVKAGAAGTLAPVAMLQGKPDGLTLACMAITSLRYPYYQEASWHPIRDFVYITGLSSYTFALVVRADSPFKTIDDLFAAGKADPEKFTFGTSGMGSSGHLMMIEIEQVLGARFTHVPYKGGAEWMQALIGGHINFIADASQWGPFVDDGRCRILAMATEQRLPRYPQVPTLTERGVKIVGQSPYGLVGPKGLPQPIVQSLHDAFTEAGQDPALQTLLDRFNQVPWKRGPAEYRAFAENYFNTVKPLLVKSGLAKP